MTSDTIAAIATARGAGGIAIIRLSGGDAGRILRACFRPARAERAFEPRRMMYGRAVDARGETLDEAMAVWMPGPQTYTREDVAEIQCHGGDVAARRVLNRALELGARPANPGEFTERAFLNGRIDLSRAEAVMQLIGANSEAAARASVRQMEGGVSGFVREISDRILALLALIEASDDFPDEVEEQAAAPEVAQGLREIIAELDRRCDPRAARLIREGASIVLAGRPNVGKSSLMNALLHQERAIVTSVPGTTRDVLTERLTLGGVCAELSDTAGRRETDDPVERIGVDRAKQAAERADVKLIVLDASRPLDAEDALLLESADERAIVCLNKADLTWALSEADVRAHTSAEIIELSARTGAGIENAPERAGSPPDAVFRRGQAHCRAAHRPRSEGAQRPERRAGNPRRKLSTGYGGPRSPRRPDRSLPNHDPRPHRLPPDRHLLHLLRRQVNSVHTQLLPRLCDAVCAPVVGA